MLAHFDKELENLKRLVQPAPESSRAPLDSPDTSKNASKFKDMTPKQALSVIPVMGPLIWNMRQSSKMYDGAFTPTRSVVDAAFIAELEALAKDAGVSDIKYVKVPPNAIFQEKGIPHEYAIRHRSRDG